MSEQDVRKHLLECAKQEFLAHGFQGASLRRICAGAGVTTGAVYFFFQNKEDMFAQIVANTAAELTNCGLCQKISCNPISSVCVYHVSSKRV